MLETSPAIRIPRIDEIPNNPETLALLKKREKANIVEGFVIHQNDSVNLPFKFYAEINVDNSRLWNLFKKITNEMPENISCIYNLYDSEPTYSDYIDKKIILKEFDKFEIELTKDCNIEFGLISQTEDELEEIFISDCKYIKFWGTNEVSFRKIMKGFYLNEVSNLNFIDEFPKVVEPLTMFIDNVRNTISVYESLNDFFANPNKKL
jgi:hypothetical protein